MDFIQSQSDQLNQKLQELRIKPEVEPLNELKAEFENIVSPKKNFLLTIPFVELKSRFFFG